MVRQPQFVYETDRKLFLFRSLKTTIPKQHWKIIIKTKPLQGYNTQKFAVLKDDWELLDKALKSSPNIYTVL